MLKRDEKTELFGRGGGGGGSRACEVVCKARTSLVMGGMVGDESRMQLQLQQGLLQKSTSREIGREPDVLRKRKVSSGEAQSTVYTDMLVLYVQHSALDNTERTN